MPILPVLLLLAACAPVAWPDPPGDRDALWAVVFAAASLLAPVTLSVMLSHHTARSLYEMPAYHRRHLRRYHRLRLLIHWTQLTLGVLAIVWGWGWGVWTYGTVTLNGVTALAPLAELIVPAPFLAGAWLGWLIHYDVMKAQHFAEASPGPVEPFWTRGGYFLYRFRRFGLLILLPVIVFAVYQSLLRFSPRLVKTPECQVLFSGLAVAGFLLLPRLAVPVLGLKRLPEGAAKAHLQAVADRLGFRCGGLLVWPTHHTVANAMVLGLLPRLRYVIFTDLLLNRFDEEEVEAVLGHEIAHIKHKHMAFYAIFLLLSLMVLFGGATAILQLSGEADAAVEPPAWVIAPLLAAMLAYFFVVFGLVSRRCERQADVAGVEAVAGGRTDGHPVAAGVNAMTRALEKVAGLNESDSRRGPETALGRLRLRLRDWQHGTFADRIAFLQRIPYEPELIARTHGGAKRFQVAVLAALVLALIAIGQVIGGAALLAML